MGLSVMINKNWYKTVTLLFAAKDETRNNAVVLRTFLEGGTAGKRG